MDPKGYVLINHEFTATKLWPGKQLTLSDGWIDMEKIYKEALAGKLAMVMDVSVDNSAYLVLGRSKEVGDFIWSIEKGDTREGSFIQVINKYGTLMPAGLSAVEEFAWLAKSIQEKEDKPWK